MDESAASDGAIKIAHGARQSSGEYGIHRFGEGGWARTMSPYSTIAVTYAAHAHVAVRRPMIRFVMFCAQRGKNKRIFIPIHTHSLCVERVCPEGDAAVEMDTQDCVAHERMGVRRMHAASHRGECGEEIVDEIGLVDVLQIRNEPPVVCPQAPVQHAWGPIEPFAPLVAQVGVRRT
jgi:hypothetical protein